MASPLSLSPQKSATHGLINASNPDLSVRGQMYRFGLDSQMGSPAPSQLAQFGIALLITCCASLLASLPMKYLDKVAIFGFSWLLFAALLIIVIIPLMAHGHPELSYAPACSPALGPEGCIRANPKAQDAGRAPFPAPLPRSHHVCLRS